MTIAQVILFCNQRQQLRSIHPQIALTQRCMLEREANDIVEGPKWLLVATFVNTFRDSNLDSSITLCSVPPWVLEDVRMKCREFEIVGLFAGLRGACSCRSQQRRGASGKYASVPIT
jgi:hypothetical protein